LKIYHFRGTLFVIDIFWKLQFLKHFIFWNYALFCQLWKCLNGHFWSMAKVVLRIWCGTWNSNLKSDLIHKLMILYQSSFYAAFMHFASTSVNMTWIWEEESLSSGVSSHKINRYLFSRYHWKHFVWVGQQTTYSCI
jgi:hypothetical protein